MIMKPLLIVGAGGLLRAGDTPGPGARLRATRPVAAQPF